MELGSQTEHQRHGTQAQVQLAKGHPTSAVLLHRRREAAGWLYRRPSFLHLVCMAV